jgi:hypothetical protein
MELMAQRWNYKSKMLGVALECISTIHVAKHIHFMDPAVEQQNQQPETDKEMHGGSTTAADSVAIATTTAAVVAAKTACHENKRHVPSSADDHGSRASSWIFQSR